MFCEHCKATLNDSDSVVFCKTCLRAEPYQINMILRSGCVLYSHPPFGKGTREIYIHRPGCRNCTLGRVWSILVCQTFILQCEECQKYHEDFMKGFSIKTNDRQLAYRVWRSRVRNEMDKRMAYLESILGELLTEEWKSRLRQNIFDKAPSRPEDCEFVKFKRGWSGLDFHQQMALNLIENDTKSPISTKNDLPSISCVPF